MGIMSGEQKYPYSFAHTANTEASFALSPYGFGIALARIYSRHRYLRRSGNNSADLHLCWSIHCSRHRLGTLSF